MKLHTLKRFFAAPVIVAALFFTGTSCKKEKQMQTYSYEFNNGQVSANAAYDGDHMDNVSAEMMLESTDDGGTMITITIKNSMDGEMYMVHAHDAADASTTPNGTPYNETPNADILVQSVEGNGGEVSVTQTTEMSFDELTTEYEGFFVIHDPLQPINTADISTYLIVGSFAREQTPTNYKSSSFDYNFNTGQIDPSFAYSGSHASNLTASINVQELAGGKSRVSVAIMNTMSGETYMVHAHDKADPSTTPNGTPYNETPNSDVMVQAATGNGGMVNVGQVSTMSHDDITMNYEAFFVIHDPLQAINTQDPTTYIVLGNFARN